MTWRVERSTGPASAFVTEPPGGSRRVSLRTVTGPALVLGSAQRDDVVDRGRAGAAGVEVVRRRAGGGAVLVRPGEILWADVDVPRSDELWHEDISVSFHWLGEAWTGALQQVGIAGAQWHEGPLVRTGWSPLVCFAGMGPGEVTIGGRKVVGLSQRRTRAGARFFCAVLLAWEPRALLDLLVLDDAARARGEHELGDVAAAAGVEASVLEAAFVDRLHGHT